MTAILRGLVCASMLASAYAAEWSMFGGDPQRTGWAKSETTLTRQNVGKLKLEWKTKIENREKELTALTVPVVAVNIPAPGGFRDIAIVAGSSDIVVALDAETGKVRWKKATGARRHTKEHHSELAVPKRTQCDAVRGPAASNGFRARQ